MRKYVAKYGFVHGRRTITKGQMIELNDIDSGQLVSNGMVVPFLEKKSDSVMSFVSQVAPVSQEPTVTKSRRGRPKKTESSVQTPVSE